MPSWSELQDEYNKLQTSAVSDWFHKSLTKALERVSKLRNNTNVIFYASAFLQKSSAPPGSVNINFEDIDGFMSVMHKMEWSKGLTLILHTPGGVTNATETIVEYLHTKFEYIEAIIPTYAMSAGTMISLATQRIVMGRQSQMGPIDPQITLSNKNTSMRAIVDLFEDARKSIFGDGKDNSGNKDEAIMWAPILQSLGPSLITEARDALAYSEDMVSRWLERRMFCNPENPEEAKAKADTVARYFSRGNSEKSHRSHGRRIDREEAKAQGVEVEYLEDNEDLQDAVLTAYHLLVVMMTSSSMLKIVTSEKGRNWIKNLPTPNR